MNCENCGVALKTNKASIKANDGLCSKCRSHKNYVKNIDTYRKTKNCPECGKSILKTSKMCNSCSQKKERDHRWKKNKQDKRIYTTFEWKQWSKAVKERDNYTCRNCGESEGKMHAHHILPKRFFIHLIYHLYNGLTLCDKCHRKVQFKEMNFITKFFGF